MRVYLSAPMTGMKDFNHPAMMAMEMELMRAGFDVINPARLPPGKTWSWYMTRAVQDLPKCDVLAQMPDWHKSHGCHIEMHLARKYKLLTRMADDLVADRKRAGVYR